MTIDHEDMPVPAREVVVGMGMRLRSLPSLMRVLVVCILVM